MAPQAKKIGSSPGRCRIFLSIFFFLPQKRWWAPPKRGKNQNFPISKLINSLFFFLIKQLVVNSKKIGGSAAGQTKRIEKNRSLLVSLSTQLTTTTVLQFNTFFHLFVFPALSAQTKMSFPRVDEIDWTDVPRVQWPSTQEGKSPTTTCVFPLCATTHREPTSCKRCGGGTKTTCSEFLKLPEEERDAWTEAIGNLPDKLICPPCCYAIRQGAPVPGMAATELVGNTDDESVHNHGVNPQVPNIEELLGQVTDPAMQALMTIMMQRITAPAQTEAAAQHLADEAEYSIPIVSTWAWEERSNLGKRELRRSLEHRYGNQVPEEPAAAGGGHEKRVLLRILVCLLQGQTNDAMHHAVSRLESIQKSHAIPQNKSDFVARQAVANAFETRSWAKTSALWNLDQYQAACQDAVKAAEKSPKQDNKRGAGQAFGNSTGTKKPRGGAPKKDTPPDQQRK